MANTVTMFKGTENGTLEAVVAKGHIKAHWNDGWRFKYQDDLIEYFGPRAPEMATDALQVAGEELNVIQGEAPIVGTKAVDKNGNLYEVDNLGNVVEVNDIGAMQAIVEGRFDLLDFNATRVLAEVYGYGARKYAEENWRGIPVKSHLNHALNHILMALHEARTGINPEPGEDHLAHALCRVHMATAIREQGGAAKEAM